MTKLHNFTQSDIKNGRGIATITERSTDLNTPRGVSFIFDCIFKENIALTCKKTKKKLKNLIRWCNCCGI